jgi:hypothetical protein
LQLLISAAANSRVASVKAITSFPVYDQVIQVAAISRPAERSSGRR